MSKQRHCIVKFPTISVFRSSVFGWYCAALGCTAERLGFYAACSACKGGGFAGGVMAEHAA
jgi:hypothetical protein